MRVTSASLYKTTGNIQNNFCTQQVGIQAQYISVKMSDKIRQNLTD